MPDDFSTFSWEEVLKLLKKFEKVFEEKNLIVQLQQK